jgi:hypothetical protein
MTSTSGDSDATSSPSPASAAALLVSLISAADSCGAKLSAAELDRAIAALGNVRAGMTPEVPRLYPRSTIAAFFYTDVIIERDHLSGDAVMCVRDPRFGWLYFGFRDSQSAAIAAVLAAIAEAPPPALGQA